MGYLRASAGQFPLKSEQPSNTGEVYRAKRCARRVLRTQRSVLARLPRHTSSLCVFLSIRSSARNHALRTSRSMRAVFLSAVATGAVAQSLPGAIAPLLSKFRAVLDGAKSADDGSVDALVHDAAADVAESLARDRSERLLADAASAAAASDVQRLKYIGACAREMSGCPVAWAPGARGECVPPVGYGGPCSATELSAHSVAQKEEFALTCKAPWPCRDCTTDFEGCPAGWGAAGRLCVAPPAYDGICSPVADFAGASESAKASWSAECGARWPCASN